MHDFKIFLPLSLALSALHLSPHALAALPPSEMGKPAIVNQAPNPSAGSLSLHQRFDHLFDKTLNSKRSKKAKTLGLAYEKLRSEKFSAALSLTSKLLEDDLFSDYASWISAAAYRKQAEKQLKHKNYSAALKAAQHALTLSLSIERNNPYSALLKTLPKDCTQAELLIGTSYWGMHKWFSAEQFFERGFQRIQGQNSYVLIGSEAVSHYAESCKQIVGPLCMGWLVRFANLYSKKSIEMQAMLKVFPALLETPKFTKHAFSRVTQAYKSTDLDHTAFEAAMKLYLDGQYSQAMKSFRFFLDDYPRSNYRFRVKYWLAQALNLEHDPIQAGKIYTEIQQESPLSYYGLLAALANGNQVETNITNTTPPSPLDSDPTLLPVESIRLRRAENFLAEKAYKLAAFELKELRYRDSMSSQFLVYLVLLNTKARNYHTGFQFIGELIQRNYSDIYSTYSIKSVFPVDFFGLIQKFSNQNNLDPLLILSLIKQESAFDEEANSPVGAVGLMQLMPGTATDTDPSVDLSDLLEGESNISVGTRYLKKLMTRFNGNVVLALAAYNAGPGAVDRWLKDTPAKRSMLEFIESIPYKETREYVGSIIRNYFWYLSCGLLTNSSKSQLKSLSDFWPTALTPIAPSLAPSPITPSLAPSLAPSPAPPPEPSTQPSPQPTPKPQT